MSKKTNTQAQGNYVLPIAIMFALFFMIAFVTGYQNPLSSVIKNMTGDNVVMSQIGNAANFIAYLCMGIPAGMLLERQGYRRTALWAVTVGFTGVLITYLSGMIDDTVAALVVYIAGAFVAGFSMCMLNTVVNPMLNSLGRTQNQGNQLVQFGGTCNSLGATLAPVIVGGLLGSNVGSISSANPVFFLAMGIFVVAFIVLMFSKLPEDPDLGKAKEKLPISGALKYSNFTFGMIAIFCYVGIEVGIANWTFSYLKDSPMVISENITLSAGAVAGSVCGTYWLFMLIGRLVGGLIGAKVSSRAMLSVTSAVAAFLLGCGIVTTESIVAFFGFDAASMTFSIANIPLNAVFFIACGLCTSVMWGAIYNLSVFGLGKYTAVASGLFMTMVCGGGILPMVQGAVSNISVLAGFWVPVVLCFYLLLYALVLSRPSRTQPQNQERLFEDGVEVEA